MPAVLSNGLEAERKTKQQGCTPDFFVGSPRKKGSTAPRRHRVPGQNAETRPNACTRFLAGRLQLLKVYVYCAPTSQLKLTRLSRISQQMVLTASRFRRGSPRQLGPVLLSHAVPGSLAVGMRGWGRPASPQASSSGLLAFCLCGFVHCCPRSRSMHQTAWARLGRRQANSLS
jgi:hypothetical protein